MRAARPAVPVVRTNAVGRSHPLVVPARRVSGGQAGILARRLVAGIGAVAVLLWAPLMDFAIRFGGTGREARDVQRALFPIEIALLWCAIALAVTALVLAWRAPLALTGRYYLGALALYGIAHLLLWRYDAYLRTFLDYGQGG